jgi:hypothetical protein
MYAPRAIQIFPILHAASLLLYLLHVSTGCEVQAHTFSCIRRDRPVDSFEHNFFQLRKVCPLRYYPELRPVDVEPTQRLLMGFYQHG